MKKYNLISILGLMLLLLSHLSQPAFCQELTYGQYLVKIAEILGMEHKLSEQASKEDYLNFAAEANIQLPADFNPATLITKKEKSALLTQALNLKGKKSKDFWKRRQIYRNKATVKELVGKVLIQKENTTEWIPAVLNMKLIEGDTIKTFKDTYVLLQVGIAGVIKIDENSELKLKELRTKVDDKAENIIIYLAYGEATIDVRNIEEDSSFETHTPSTVTAVRGTIYIVNVEGNNGKTDIRETKLIE